MSFRIFHPAIKAFTLCLITSSLLVACAAASRSVVADSDGATAETPEQRLDREGVIRVAADNFTFETQTGERFLPMGAYYLQDRHPEPDPLHWWDAFDEEQLYKDFAFARELGYNTMRVTFHFPVVDRNPAAPVVGTPEDFEKCDIIIDAARKNGLRLYAEPRLDNYATWVQDGAARPYWINIFEQLTARYPDEPAIFCWEVDSEAVTLVGYEGDREMWDTFLLERYGSLDGAADAWGLNPCDPDWQQKVWDDMTTRLKHDGSYDERFGMKPTLWYLDFLNHPNDTKLYDWQLYRDYIYTEKLKPIVAAVRQGAPNQLVSLDLISWTFPLVRNQVPSGWGGPYAYAGVDVRAMGELFDFIGVHSYPMYIPPFTTEWYEDLTKKEETFTRQLRYIETYCRYVRANTGVPVVHTETGWHGGEGDYYGNTEEDQRRWGEAMIEDTKDCAIGWLNWTFKDVPTHEGLTAYGGLLTRGIRVKPDVDDVNIVGDWIYDGPLPDEISYQPKAWGLALGEVTRRMHTDPDVGFKPGKRMEVSRKLLYTGTMMQLDAILQEAISDENFPCDIYWAEE